MKTASQERPFVGVAIEEDGSSLQTFVREGELCVVDGRIFSERTLRSESNETLSRGGAAAMLKTWQRQGLAGLREAPMTASTALWDAGSNRLILARAEDGIPPIFLAETEDVFLWSNSIKTLLRYGVEPELNLLAVDAYFGMGYVPSPWTLLKNVQKVPTGRLVDYTPGGLDLRRHREPVSRTREVEDVETGAATLKRKLCRTLEKMVDGYDRVGVLLSSGVDSSLLVGLLHCELGVSVEAFTFDYTGYEGKFNEYDRARMLTSQYDIPHHKIKYRPDWLNANLAKAVRQYEEPFTYGQHTAPLEGVTDKGVELLINGVKGEVFISRTAQYAMRLDGGLAETVAKYGSDLLQTWPFSKLSRESRPVDALKYALRVIRSSASEIVVDHHTNSILSQDVRRRLFADSRLPEAGREAVLQLIEKESPQASLPRKAERVSHLGNTFFICDHVLWWNYRWAHANGLETGAPFCAPAVQSWTQSLRQPLWPPYQESIMKVLIRRAAATVMPEEIAYYEKIGQSSPFFLWLRNSLHPLLDEYLQTSKLEEEEIFNVEFASDRIEDVSNPYLVWQLLCYMAWKREFFDSDWKIRVE